MPIVPDFEGEELLYRRYSIDHFRNGGLLPAALKFPEDSGPSFNRSRFSQAEHVLHPDCCLGKILHGWGVLECSVRAVPSPITSYDGRSFMFFPVHMPKRTCYAHSEVWSKEIDSTADAYQKPPSSVRETFRVLLSRALNVKIPAST
jgi:hypothetical protein